MRTMVQMVVQCLKLYCQGYERFKQAKKVATPRLRISEVQVFTKTQKDIGFFQYLLKKKDFSENFEGFPFFLSNKISRVQKSHELYPSLIDKDFSENSF